MERGVTEVYRPLLWLNSSIFLVARSVWRPKCRLTPFAGRWLAYNYQAGDAPESLPHLGDETNAPVTKD